MKNVFRRVEHRRFRCYLPTLAAFMVVIGVAASTPAAAQNIWALGGGLHASFDAFVGRVQLIMPGVSESMPELEIVPLGEIGFGSQSSLNYIVIRVGGEARYMVEVGEEDAGVRVYPSLGVGLYRWQASDCTGCTSNDLFFTLGGGVRVNRFDIALALSATGQTPDLMITFAVLLGGDSSGN